MTTASQLRTKARRYRELAAGHRAETADGLRFAADHLDRQADALDAYAATARLTTPHALTTTV